MTELGQALKEAREEKGLSLDEIQEITKIQKRYLVAIENGDFDILPGQFYIRAFIKSYTEALGLDTEEFFYQYANEIPRPTHHEIESLPPRKVRAPSIKSKDSGVTNLLPKLLIVVVLIIVVIGIYITVVHMNSNKEDSNASSDQTGDISLEKGSDIGNHQSKSGNTSDQSSTADQEKSDQEKDSTTTDETDDAEDKPSQELKVTQTSGSTSTFTLTGTDKFHVQIEAIDGQRSWVTAAEGNAQGTRFFFNNVSSAIEGQDDVTFDKDLSDVDSLYLKIGNTKNAVIKINGEKLKYPVDIVSQSITINFKKDASDDKS